MVNCMHYAWATFGQFSDDLFMPNPADLGVIKTFQMQAGVVYVNPQLSFQGVAPLGVGKVQSTDLNFLPFYQIDKRLNDKIVLGFNINPYYYGSVKWPENSILSPASTRTKLMAYIYSPQMSMKLTDKLTVGLGFNIVSQKQSYLDNKIRGNIFHNEAQNVFYTVALGVDYRINEYNILGLSYYSTEYD